MKRLCTFLVLLASACAYGQVGPVSITSAECATIGVGAKVSVITFQVTGTWTGTLQPKITVQGQAAANVQVTPSTSSTAASTVTANGIYTAQVNGADTFQVCGNTVASGTANVYLNTSVASKGGSSGSGSSGTVTSVTFTGDGVVDSSTPSTAVTASGTVAATIKTQTAHTFLGNNTGSTAAPVFAALALADLPGTVVNATSPGAGIGHFAGSTQTLTSSLIVAADITSATITGTQIASSVALAGSPTTTTQAAGDSSTKLATTAFVAATVASKTSCNLTGSSDSRTSDGTFATTCTIAANGLVAGSRIIVDAVGTETFTSGPCSGSASTFGVDYDSTVIMNAGNSDSAFANSQAWSFHGEFVLAVSGASGRIHANPGYTMKQDGTALLINATAAQVAYDSTASHVLKIHLTNSGTGCGPYVLTQFNVQQVF